MMEDYKVYSKKWPAYFLFVFFTIFLVVMLFVGFEFASATDSGFYVAVSLIGAIWFFSLFLLFQIRKSKPLITVGEYGIITKILFKEKEYMYHDIDEIYTAMPGRYKALVASVRENGRLKQKTLIQQASSSVKLDIILEEINKRRANRTATPEFDSPERVIEREQLQLKTNNKYLRTVMYILFLYYVLVNFSDWVVFYETNAYEMFEYAILLTIINFVVVIGACTIVGELMIIFIKKMKIGWKSALTLFTLLIVSNIVDFIFSFMVGVYIGLTYY